MKFAAMVWRINDQPLLVDARPVGKFWLVVDPRTGNQHEMTWGAFRAQFKPMDNAAKAAYAAAEQVFSTSLEQFEFPQDNVK